MPGDVLGTATVTEPAGAGVALSALRCVGGREREAMQILTLAAVHPLVTRGTECAACGKLLAAGDRATVVPLGPGADAAARAAAVAGGPYVALGVVCHAACAGLEHAE